MTDPATVPPQLPGVVVRLMGGLRRAGPVALRARTTLVTFIGGVDLDLTDAIVPAYGSRITKVSLIGGMDIVVPADVRVDVGAFALAGGKDVERAAGVPATAPVLHIRSWSLVGGVRVRVAA